MAETGAIFGGEHSGHFYFRDFWRADSGMLAALHALAALAETDRPLSELLGEYERYVLSGEINSTVADQVAVTAEIEAAYAGRDGVSVDRLDGLTVSHPDWWFNVRPSNTEPLLRLNAEGRDEATMSRGPRRRARDHQEGTPVNIDPGCWRSSSARSAGPGSSPWPRSSSAPAAASSTRSGTTSPCCWSTRPASPPEGTCGHGDLVRRVPPRRRGGPLRQRPAAAPARRGRRPGAPGVRSTPRRPPPRRWPAARTWRVRGP